MPVYTQMEDGILRVVVDGDYTSSELRRKGSEAARTAVETLGGPVFVLLDFSGAAGLRNKRATELRETAAFFASQPSLARVAVVAVSDLAFGLMRMGATFGAEEGLQVQAFRDREMALAWLAEGRQGRRRG